jgi:ABC-type cobalt transport system substrate-binding protein
MKPIREWQAGDIEPAIFGVAFLVVALIIAFVFGYFNPVKPGDDHYDLDYHNGHTMH